MNLVHPVEIAEGTHSEKWRCPSRRIDINAKIGFEKLRDVIIGHTEIVFHFGSHCQDDRAELVAGGAESIRGLQRITAVMPALATGTKPGLDFELAFNGGDNDIGLERRVGLQVGQMSAAIGTSGDGDRDNLVDVLGFGAVGWGMVVGPAWVFGVPSWSWSSFLRKG